MSYAVPLSLNMPPWARRGPGGRARAQRRMMWAAQGASSTPDERPGPGAQSSDADTDQHGPHAGRGGHPRGGRGRGPGGPGPWGGRGPWGPPRGRRRERGDVRAAILLLLAEQPRHGYEILTELADRSDGQWQPSPGSIYPVLKRLARDGLVSAAHEDGKRIFSLTDEGRSVVEKERAAWGEPWAQAGNPGDDAANELWSEGKQLGAAVWQVSQLNDLDQLAAATAILAEARKRIYGLLAQ